MKFFEIFKLETIQIICNALTLTCLILSASNLKWAKFKMIEYESFQL